MDKFKVELDVKHTVWYRTTAEIFADSLEDAKRIAKEMFIKDEIDDLEDAYTEVVYDTTEEMTVLDNGGSATKELFVDGQFVADNVAEERENESRN